MTETLSEESPNRKPVRIWPGIIIGIMQLLVWVFIPVIFSGAWTGVISVLGGILASLFVLAWWVFFSRAPWFDRLGAVVLWVAALFIAYQLTDVSIITGMQGLMFFALSLPLLSMVFVVWAVASRGLSGRYRRVTMVVAVFLACGFWIVVRSEGITGNAGVQLVWRWSQTHEDELMAQTAAEMKSTEGAPDSYGTRVEWPGFRGVDRNSIVHDLLIATDWAAMAPEELWRRPVGPGCSSFAVRGNLLYTQEQRGEDEVVACYSMDTGEPVWNHSDKARFWDSHAGAGPRSTPTIADSLVYTLGATGILNVLDALDGSVVWSRDAAADAEAVPPGWGFTSSPLVIDTVVIVALSGKLAAYNITTSQPLWFGPEGGESYSSPHLFTIGGIPQVLMMNNNGATSFSPADGTILWNHPWPGSQIVQPAICDNGDLLISAPNAKGIRRIAVKLEAGNWTVTELWTSTRLKPNFNDFVIHKGYAYGFEGPSLECIDIKDGSRMWKGGRYGGQIILLAEQDLLLVLLEKGELALVEAVPEELTELARMPAIEGKTWNHPIIAGDILVVRNTQEMAAFRLPAGGT